MSAIIPLAIIGGAGAFFYSRNKKKEQEEQAQAQAQATRAVASQRRTMQATQSRKSGPRALPAANGEFDADQWHREQAKLRNVHGAGQGYNPTATAEFTWDDGQGPVTETMLLGRQMVSARGGG